MPRGVRITAWHLLLVAVLGIMSRYQSVGDLERFAIRHYTVLTEGLGLEPLNLFVAENQRGIGRTIATDHLGETPCSSYYFWDVTLGPATAVSKGTGYSLQ
jgi:hypothetical protein